MRQKWNSKNARLRIQSLHASKSLQFRTRTSGTPRQIGKVFPVGNKLPVKSRPKVTSAYPGVSAKKLAGQEARTLPFDGFTAVLRMKNGSVKTIPIAASSYADFIEKLKPRLKDIDSKQVKEISVAGGGKFFESLSSGLSKVGSAAKGFVEGIKTGTGNWAKSDQPGSVAQAIGRRLGTQARELPSKIESSMIGSAEKFGQISSFPKRMEESYKRGLDPHASELEKLKKDVESEQLRQKLRKYQHYSRMYPSPGPANEPISTKSWRENTQARTAKREKKLELDNLRRRISLMERAGVAGWRINGLRIRAQELDDEIAKAGGKIMPRRRVSFKAKGKTVTFVAK